MYKTVVIEKHVKGQCKMHYLERHGKYTLLLPYDIKHDVYRAHKIVNMNGIPNECGFKSLSLKAV